MPNRLIREGILTSDRVNELTLGAELFYRRLMSVVDDFGRFDARPVMLKVACFPLRVDVVREADISHWTASCEKAGLIALYAVKGKPYLEMQDFRQQVRAKQSKYPPPADATQTPCACDAPAPVVEVGDVVEENQRRAAKKLPLPDWIPIEAWKRWARHRGGKLTAQAQVLQIGKLDTLRGLGHDPAAMIDLAIESGWATFYPPKAQGGNGKSSSGWWDSEAGTLAKGRELGLNPRPGEMMGDFRGRIRDRLGAT